jgi:low affinity Fe/Cu permease
LTGINIPVRPGAILPARKGRVAAVPREWNLLERAFNRISKAASRLAGRPLSFALALALILAWMASGPLFGFSDSWQLVVNTATTIVTFVMVFLIQNTQNRDTEAIQIKLDELIRATEAASNTLLDLEELDERTLDGYRARYEALALKARKQKRTSRSGADSVREEDGA